jgi:hypothetical protein
MAAEAVGEDAHPNGEAKEKELDGKEEEEIHQVPLPSSLSDAEQEKDDEERGPSHSSVSRDDILRTLLDSYLSREAQYDALMRSHNERLLGMWRGFKETMDGATQRQQLALRSGFRGLSVVPDARRCRGYGLDL